MNGLIGEVYVSVGADLSTLNSQLGGAVPAAAKAGESAGRQFASGFDQTAIKTLRASLDTLGSDLQGIGATLSIGVTAPLVALGVASISASADIDALKRGLIATTGSAEEAERQFIELREVAKLPGQGLEEAARGAVNLQAFGFSAQQSVEILKSFGNALATVGKGRVELDRVILQLGQMAGAGRVLMQDLRPIIQQVPQVATIIREQLGPEGLSAPQETLERLGLTTQDFIQILVTELGKLPPVTGGLKNDLENFSDSIKIALARVGDAMTPVVSVIINTLVPAIETAVDIFTGLPQPIQTGIVVLAGLAAAIGPVVLIAGTMARGLSDLIGLLVAFRGASAAAAGAQGLGALSGGLTGLSGNLAGLVGAGGALALFSVGLLSVGAAAIATANDIEKLRAKADAFAESMRAMRIADLLREGKTVEEIQALGFALDEIKGSVTGAAISFEGMNQKIRDLIQGGATAEQMLELGYSADQISAAVAGAKDTTAEWKAPLDGLGLGIKIVGEAAKPAAVSITELTEAEKRGETATQALALAKKDLRGAHDALTPSVAEYAKKQKEAAEAERDRIKYANEVANAFAAYGVQLQQIGLDMEAAKIAGDQLNTVWINGVGYIREYSDAERATAAEGVESLGELQRIVTGLTVSVKDVGVAAGGTQVNIQNLGRDGGEAITAGLNNSLQTTLDKLQQIPSALTGVTASIRELRGSGSADILTLADALAKIGGETNKFSDTVSRLSGKIKDGTISMSDYLGVAEKIPKWVRDGTVAIIDGVRVLSDDAIKKHEAAEAAEKLAHSNHKGAESYRRLADDATKAGEAMAAAAAKANSYAANPTAHGFTPLSGGGANLPGFGPGGNGAAGTGLPNDLMGYVQSIVMAGAVKTGPELTAVANLLQNMGLARIGLREFDDPDSIITRALAGVPGGAADLTTAANNARLTNPTLYAHLTNALKELHDRTASASAAIATLNTSLISAADVASDLSKQTQSDLIPTYEDLEDQLWRLIDAGKGNSSQAFALRNELGLMGNVYEDGATAVDTFRSAGVRAGSAMLGTADIVEQSVQKITVAAGDLARKAGITTLPDLTTPGAPSVPRGPAAGLVAFPDSTTYTGGGNGGVFIDARNAVFGPDSPQYFLDQLTELLRREGRLG